MSFIWLIALALLTIGDAFDTSSTLPHSTNESCHGACESSDSSRCSDSPNSINISDAKEGLRSEIASTACTLDADHGSGTNFTVKWFYDTLFGNCARFWYSGCGGNENRFNTQKKCEDVCISPKGRDVCNLTASHGPCENYLVKWFYDSSRKQCNQFVYGGCLGNDNKFDTHEACVAHCAIPVNTGSNEGNIAATYVLKDPCDAVRAECNTIYCVYNVEAYIDENGCERCRCVDACSNVTCPVNSHCTMTLSAAAMGGSKIEGVCRSTTNAGRCPVVSNSTRCEQECASDADCSRGWKCCSNGCGTSCLEPTPGQPVYIPPQSPFNVTSQHFGAAPAEIVKSDEPRVSGEEGMYIDPECQDNKFFAQCDLIVQAKYCGHKYYVKFCCRSCTKAGQLPSHAQYRRDSSRGRSLIPLY